MILKFMKAMSFYLRFYFVLRSATLEMMLSISVFGRGLGTVQVRRQRTRGEGGSLKC